MVVVVIEENWQQIILLFSPIIVIGLSFTFGYLFRKYIEGRKKK